MWFWSGVRWNKVEVRFGGCLFGKFWEILFLSDDFLFSGEYLLTLSFTNYLMSMIIICKYR